MPSIHYDKAVRDKIPEIITAEGKTCVVEQVPASAFLARLMDKLDEEFAEFKQDPCVEELADTLEVLMAIAKYHGFAWADVEQARVAKAAQRGAFEQRLVLVRVEE